MAILCYDSARPGCRYRAAHGWELVIAATVIDYLERNFRERGGSVFAYFIRDERTEVITHADLLRRAAAYAEHYRKVGVHAGDSVIIILQHCPDLLYAFVGALLHGAVPSFMPFPSHKQDVELYWTSHRKLFERIGTRALVTYEENLPALRQHVGLAGLHVATPGDIAHHAAIEPKFNAAAPEAIALLQHTSGTTGLKKGIALAHRAIVNQVRSYASVLGLGDQDCIASWLPLYHDMGLIACFIQPLLLGVPVVMMDPFEWVLDPAMLLRAVETYRATFVWLPNFSFQHMALTVDTSLRCNIGQVKAFVNCSEPCKSATFTKFLETFAPWGVRREQLQTCYAMAETVFAVTQTKLQEPVLETDGFLSVGQPIPGIEVRVVDEARRAVPDGVVGEIAITGDCLFSGYYCQPDETHAVLDACWFYSGDLGFKADGHLYIAGRKKDLIIVNGRNYYAHHLEEIANRVDGVKKGRVVAIGIFNPSVGSENAVLIAETPAIVPDECVDIARSIKTAVLRELDLAVADVHLVARDWIVKTTSGKISREENKAKYLREREAVTQPLAA